MADLQSKPLIELNLDTREITITNNIKYIDIDKNIANIFLQIYREDNTGLKAYLTKEELDSFVGKMFLIKPVTNDFAEITGMNTEEFKSDNGGGVLRFIIPTEYTNRNGIVKCEIHINKDNELLASDRFVYNVKQSLVTQFNNDLLEDSDFPILQQLILEIQKDSNIDDTRISKTTTYSSYKINSQINEKANDSDLALERKRIDNLARLEDGSTTGDAELQDIRLGADGIQYDSAGNAVRNIGKKVIEIQGGKFLKGTINGYNKKPLLNTAFAPNNATQTILTNNGRNIVWNKQGNFMGVIDSTIINDEITLSQTDRILFISKITVNQNDFNTLDYRLNLSGLGAESIYKTVITTENNKEYYLGGIVPINSDYTTPTARGITITIASLNDTSKTINVDINSVYVFIIRNASIELDTSNMKVLYDQIDNNVFNVIQKTPGRLDLIEKDIDLIEKDIKDLKGNINIIDSNNSKWKSKNVLVLGDSISSDYYLRYDSWATQLSKLKEFNLVNRSVHANGFICSPDSVISGDDSMINKIDTVHSQYPNASDFDLIIMFMGTNDFGNGVPLGKFGDGNKDKSSITTFHGGVEYCMRKALEYWCSARIVVFTPMQRRTQIYATSEGKNLKDYRDVIIEKANYMGYPVLDLYSISGFYPVKKAFNAIITTDGTENTNNAFCNMYCMKPDGINPDGLHPNELFTTSRLVPLISSFIENI